MTFYLTPNDIGVRVMVFNATVNNISVTVMDLLQVTDMLYHKIYQAYLAMVAQANVNATTIRSLLWRHPISNDMLMHVRDSLVSKRGY